MFNKEGHSKAWLLKLYIMIGVLYRHKMVEKLFKTFLTESHYSVVMFIEGHIKNFTFKHLLIAPTETH